ncbi:MAG: biopolymer transporter ExbD [Flavobacteriales bacterium]|nr:biopolymer transporter ExbD [Flavobacteriales bacterium]
MKDLRSKNRVKAEGGGSAMTDLVFLLLIFFILVSTMVSNPNIALNLPTASPIDVPSDKEVIKVGVSAANTFHVGADGTEVNGDDLEAAIMAQVAMTGDSIVELSGDQTSYWQSGIMVIDVAKKNQLKLVVKTKN